MIMAATTLSTPIKVGRLDDDGDLFDDPRPVFARSTAAAAAGILRFGLEEDDDLVDTEAIVAAASASSTTVDQQPQDKPLTLADLGSDTHLSAASFVPMPDIPTRPFTTTTLPPSTSSLTVDPAHVGSVSMKKIQAVKRDHSLSFAATTPITHSTSLSSTLQSPAKRAKVSSDQSDVGLRSVSLFGFGDVPVTSDRSDTDQQADTDAWHLDSFVDPRPQRAKIVIDPSINPSIYVAATRPAPYLFGPRGVTARIVNPEPTQYPDGTVGYEKPGARFTVTLQRPVGAPSLHSTSITDPSDVLSVLQRAVAYTRPTPPFTSLTGIALPTVAKIHRFSFTESAAFLPTGSRARTLLDLLGVMFDAPLDTVADDHMAVDADDTMPLLPQALIDMKAKCRMQSWLAGYLAPAASAAATQHLAQGGSPLHAIRLLVASRQLGAACALATQRGHPRLALCLAAASADPGVAQAHVAAAAAHPGVDPDYLRIVQLAALGPLDAADGPLPTWAKDALAGLSVSQALAHLLAAYPVLTLPEVVQRLVQFEQVLAPAMHGSMDEVLMEVVLVATLPGKAGDYVRSLVQATLGKQTDGDEVSEWVGMTLALSGLVAQGVKVHASDFARVLVATAPRLEAVGKWHLATLVVQLLAVAPGQEMDTKALSPALRNRAVLDLVARNVAGGRLASRVDGAAAQVTGRLTKEERFVVDLLKVPVELVLEAKAMAVANDAVSSLFAEGIHKLPIPLPTSSLTNQSLLTASQSLFPSLGTNAAATKVLIPHRFTRRKTQAERALEYARVLELVTLAYPFAYSTGAIELAQAAVRYLVPVYVLDDDWQAAVDTVVKFESLVDGARRLGMWVASQDSVRPALIKAILWYRDVLAAAEVSGANRGTDAAVDQIATAMRRKAEQVVEKLAELGIRRGDELDHMECAAISAMVFNLTCQYEIDYRMRIPLPAPSLED